MKKRLKTTPFGDPLGTFFASRNGTQKTLEKRPPSGALKHQTWIARERKAESKKQLMCKQREAEQDQIFWELSKTRASRG